MTAPRTLLLAAALATLAPGCVIYDQDAQVSFEWDFFGLDCETANVDIVYVTLENADFGDTFESGAVPCRELAVSFDDVDPGTYFVEIVGVGVRGETVVSDEVDVHGGDNVFHVHLEPIP